MKWLITATAVCMLVLAPATGATFTWDGGGDTKVWSDALNWTGDTAPTVDSSSPATDSITISAANVGVSDFTEARHAYSDAGTAYWDDVSVISNGTHAMTLRKNGTQGMDIEGTLTLEGFSSSKVTKLDVDQSMSATSTTIKSYVDVDVAASRTFTSGALTVGSGTDVVDLLIGVDSGTGTLDASSMTIQAGDAANEDAFAELRSATLDVDGQVLVQASTTVDATAEIQITSGTFTPDSMKFVGRDHATEGHAIADFDVSVTVQGACDGTIDTCMEGYVDINVFSNTTTDFKDMEIGDCGASGNAADVDVAGGGTVRACSLVINGGDTQNTIVSVTSGKVETY